MANIEEILGRQINSVKELKSAISDLQNSLIGVDTESEQFKTTSQQLAAAQEELTKVTRAGKEENVAATDSLVGMQQEYKKLYDQYKMLTEEQRNSDFGKNMAASLEQLSSKMNEVKQGAGNFKDNIGRYADDIGKAFDKAGLSISALQGPLKNANTGFKALNTTMKANPIGLVIGAITALIAIFAKVKSAVGENEELQMRWNEAMAKFQPIVDTAKNALDFLAGALVKVIEFVAKGVQKIREFGAAVTDFFGITKGRKAELQEQQKVYDDITKSINQLTKNKRKYQELNAYDKKRVEALREEASEITNLEEKNKLLTKAKEIQAQIDQRNIEIAQEELRILEEQATLTANDAAMNDKLAAATAKVSDAEAQAAANARMFNRQLGQSSTSANSAASSYKKATKAVQDYREEAKKLYEDLLENNKTEVQKLTEKYEKEKKLLEKYHYDTTLLTKQYQKEISKINAESLAKNLKTSSDIYSYEAKQITRQMALIERDSGVTKAIEEKIKSFETDTRGRIEAIKKAMDEAAESVKDSPLATALNTLFEVGDISKATNYETIIDRLNYKIKELDGNEEDVKKFKAALDAVTAGGEEGWTKLTQGIEDASNRLAAFDDIVIQVGKDVDGELKLIPLKVEDLRKELQEALGDIDINKVAKGVADGLEVAYKQAFDLIKEMGITKEKIGFLDMFAFEGWDKSTARLIFKDWNFDYIKEAVLEKEYEMLETQKSNLENSLNDFKGTQEQKLELLQQYYAVAEELENRHKDLSELNQVRILDMVNNLAGVMDSIGSGLGTIKSSYEQVIDSELKAGKIDEKTANDKKKRLEKLEIAQQAFAIATIAADAATGLFSIWKGYALETGTINPQTAAAAGPAAAGMLTALNTKSLVTAIAKTTSLAATATAQIMAARNGVVASQNNFAAESGNSSSPSVGATPALIDSRPYEYTRTVQTQEEEDALNQPVWVSIVDVENALGHRVVVKDESSF